VDCNDSKERGKGENEMKTEIREKMVGDCEYNKRMYDENDDEVETGRL
jgi:hypothetical protein